MGIIFERRAKAQLHRAVPNSGPRAYEWLREAMVFFVRPERARMIASTTRVGSQETKASMSAELNGTT